MIYDINVENLEYHIVNEEEFHFSILFRNQKSSSIIMFIVYSSI
jgi:hypothetical protein